MNLGPFLALAGRWRQEAGVLRARNAPYQAALLDGVADELEVTISAWGDEELTLRQAEEESGYSYSTLQQYTASGELPNAGAPGNPRIRRGDLPYRGSRRREDAHGDRSGTAADRVLLRRLGG